ncbi:hypothetical protein RD792_017271 [Penstemon davidsonii]|uniref:Uncharacterized protein n=1 Tax=Penstemon davidsonii TaxID=160366 RepID=A0ABR0CLK2_9LAMI|nr:hypothetical protein RD792_017271 [Penstemon davidsonii]
MASLNLNKDSATTVTRKGTQSLKIHGFSFTKGMGVGKYISSDIFFVGGHLWQIQFYPDGKNPKRDNYVSLYITLVSKCEEDVRAWFEYVLLDESGNKWHKSDVVFKMAPKDTQCMVGPYTLHDGYRTIGYDDFYKRTELESSQFVKDDCLTFQCTVGVVKTSMESPKTVAQMPDLRQSYAQLLESGEGSDVSFEVEGETFYAHKLILSTRSPVFKAQFYGPLKEENTRLIKIDEMQAPVFKALLHFIYCDVIPDDSRCVDTTMTQHLLVAADRYGIEKLRSLCEVRLCENIGIDTVASSLALAEQHGCIQLRSTSLEFIGLPENLEERYNFNLLTLRPSPMERANPGAPEPRASPALPPSPAWSSPMPFLTRERAGRRAPPSPAPNPFPPDCRPAPPRNPPPLETAPSPNPDPAPGPAISIGDGLTDHPCKAIDVNLVI